MEIFRWFGFVLLAALLVGCAGSVAPVVTNTAESVNMGTIRFALADAPSTRDIPLLMALDLLEQEGYTIERMIFAETEMTLEALARGDADMASSGLTAAWTAISNGAAIHSVVGRTKYSFGILTRKDIETCADLDGQPFAMRTTTGINPAMLTKYVENHCPGITLNPVVIGSSESRRAAMLSGEIGASFLEPDDLLEMEKESPGQFHMLVNLGNEFPGLIFNVVSVGKAWGEQHPELVQAFIRALLTSIRSINTDSKVLEDNLVQRLSMAPDEAQETAAVYLNPSVWDNNGSMTTETVQFNIDFLEAAEAIPPGLTVEDLVDLSYLNAVLDDIGRQ